MSTSRFKKSAARLQAADKAAIANDGSTFAMRLTWSPFRLRLYSVLSNHYFELVMGAVIVFNVVLVVLQVDADASGYVPPPWLMVVPQALVVIYVIEVAVRIYVARLLFFFNEFNNLDFAVVAIDLISMMAEAVMGDAAPASVFRVARLAKLIRTARLFKNSRELQVMIGGMAGACRALACGGILVFMMLLMWSIIAVATIQPLVRRMAAEGAFHEECVRCPRCFASVSQSMLTFLTLVLGGEGWTDFFNPIIEHHPWTLLPLVLAPVTVNLGILNLMLSAIVDNAKSVVDTNEVLHLKSKNDVYYEAKTQLEKLCAEMDTDQSGQLTEKELKNGYADNGEFFDMLHKLDVEEEDLSMVFRAVDLDGSGAISANEFIDQVYKMKTQEDHSFLLQLTWRLQEMKAVANDAVHCLKNEILQKQQEEVDLLKEIVSMKGMLLQLASASASELPSGSMRTADLNRSSLATKSRKRSADVPSWIASKTEAILDGQARLAIGANSVVDWGQSWAAGLPIGEETVRAAIEPVAQEVDVETTLAAADPMI